jgi:hypothetical protein
MTNNFILVVNLPNMSTRTHYIIYGINSIRNQEYKLSII